MKRYFALPRGVNMCGKNKMPMAELKEGLAALGFEDVKTRLNSGNAAFFANEDEAVIAAKIEAMTRERFSLNLPVFVMAKETLEDILSRAPDWRGGPSKEFYGNLIFIMPPATFPDVYAELGEPKAGIEQIESCGQAIFWSFSRKDYQKTAWWPKTATASRANRLAIRSANTVRRLLLLG